MHTPAAADPPPAPTRARPLIYVYELPPIYNQLLLAYRIDPVQCVPRFFKARNGTIPLITTYALELALHEYFLQSEQRTLNPEVRRGIHKLWSWCQHFLRDSLSLYRSTYFNRDTEFVTAAQEADYFYIPVYVVCNAHPIHGFSDFPWFHGGPGANRAQAASNMLIEAHSWLRSRYPYWDRRGGADHIIVSTTAHINLA